MGGRSFDQRINDSHSGTCREKTIKLLSLNICGLKNKLLLPEFHSFISHYDIIGFQESKRGARWLSGRVSDSGARGPGFETYRRRVVSLSKTLYSPKVLVNYPGSDGSVPI